jgi:hypothetical protein
MATDVRLDEVDGSYLVLDARVVKHAGSDFMLDAAARRHGGGPFRRALVHDESDGLTINFAGDYPGGVTLVGVSAVYPKAEAGQSRFNVPTLVVHGGISYEAQGVSLDGSAHTVTVGLDDELNKLQAQITALTARVAALEAKVNG